MQVKQLIADDDAVSPVIGVILMVAITVILAAVIATFVLGLGEQISDTSPQANFDFDYEDVSAGPDNLTATHTGGSTIDAANLHIVGTSTGNDLPWTGSFELGGTGSPTEWYSSGSDVSTGGSLTFSVNPGDTVRVVWQTDEGGQSAEMAIWQGPDA